MVLPQWCTQQRAFGGARKDRQPYHDRAALSLGNHDCGGSLIDRLVTVTTPMVRWKNNVIKASRVPVHRQGAAVFTCPTSGHSWHAAGATRAADWPLERSRRRHFYAPWIAGFLRKESE